MTLIFTVCTFAEVFDLKSEIKLGDILRVDPIGFKAPKPLFRNITGHNDTAEDWEEIIMDDDMRYFLITAEQLAVMGEYVRYSAKFPSRSQIMEDLITQCGFKNDNFVILNIFEFKSAEDCYSFLSK